MSAVTGSAVTRRRRLERPNGVGAPASRAPSTGDPAGPGDPREFIGPARSTRPGVPPHGPHRGTAEGQLDLPRHLEAVATVEGDVGVLGGFEIGRNSLG